jgi:hypothetical protein
MPELLDHGVAATPSTSNTWITGNDTEVKFVVIIHQIYFAH